MLRGVGDRSGSRETLVVDIGGGSTELVTARVADEPRRRRGAADGALPRTDPPTRDELDGAPRSSATQLPPLDVERRRRRRRHDHDRSPRSTSVSTSTTASACTGTALPLEASSGSSNGSPRCRSRERREVPALEPERAPVIVGGAVIVREVLDRYGARGDPGQRARHPRRDRARSGRAAGARRGRRAARRLHLLLSHSFE